MFFETAKSILQMVSALFPIVNPIGGSPVFLLLTQDYSRESRKAGAPGGHEQFHSADSFLGGRDAHSFFFRNFIAGGANGRRIDGRFDRLGNC
jgi:hypothetical protein